MLIDKVLKCPSCNADNPTIALEEKDNSRFLHCISCNATFPFDKRDSFFLFFKERGGATGHLLSEYEKDLYANKNFRDFHLSNTISDLKLALKDLRVKVIIDIGCGNGGYTNALKGLYQDYYGLEPSEIPNKETINEPYLQKGVTLIHYDPAKNLPIHNGSADAAVLIASYDHIPDVENVVKDIYNKLNDNGYLIIVMQNYHFWIKNIINRVSGKRLFRGESDHYRVHSPDTLIKETRSFVDLEVKSIRADSIFLPNLPKRFGFIYFSKNMMIFVNSLIKHLFLLFPKKNLGSVMTVVFKKSDRGF